MPAITFEKKFWLIRGTTTPDGSLDIHYSEDSLNVLDTVAEKGDWGKPLPSGVHRGIAQFMGYGSYSAAVAEVSVSPQGKLRVHRLVLAVNSGHVVNPGQVEAQAQGSVAFGLTATMYGEMPVENGRMASHSSRAQEMRTASSSGSSQIEIGKQS